MLRMRCLLQALPTLFTYIYYLRLPYRDKLEISHGLIKKRKETLLFFGARQSIFLFEILR
jgi:hypothetical protein